MKKSLLKLKFKIIFFICNGNGNWEAAGGRGRQWLDCEAKELEWNVIRHARNGGILVSDNKDVSGGIQLWLWKSHSSTFCVQRHFRKDCHVLHIPPSSSPTSLHTKTWFLPVVCGIHKSGSSHSDATCTGCLASRYRHSSWLGMSSYCRYNCCVANTRKCVRDVEPWKWPYSSRSGGHQESRSLGFRFLLL